MLLIFNLRIPSVVITPVDDEEDQEFGENDVTLKKIKQLNIEPNVDEITEAELFLKEIDDVLGFLTLESSSKLEEDGISPYEESGPVDDTSFDDFSHPETQRADDIRELRHRSERAMHFHLFISGLLASQQLQKTSSSIAAAQSNGGIPSQKKIVGGNANRKDSSEKMPSQSLKPPDLLKRDGRHQNVDQLRRLSAVFQVHATLWDFICFECNIVVLFKIK